MPKYLTKPEIEWRTANYPLWLSFYTEAERVRSTGRKHYSARTIAEVLRHNAAVRGDDPHFKINNNVIPLMARMYMTVARCPGFFETRNKESKMAQVLVNEDARCVVDGVEYHAKTQAVCDGCAGDYDLEDKDASALCMALSNCSRHTRTDGTNVIWVRAE